jgi:hypothetical protein
MIADLDETIRELLLTDLAIKNGGIDISFDQPKQEWSARLNRPTINLFLYDVRENPMLRQHQWEQVANGNGNRNQASRKRSPFRIDCLYMLTTWVKDQPEEEHRLLTRCMMVLFRYPNLPEDRLIGSLRHPPYNIQAQLASHDKLTNPAEVWSALDNELRPSVPYVVTIALDPWDEVSGGLVRTLTMRYGQAEELPQQHRLGPDPGRVDANLIGGVVRGKGKDGGPLVGVEVAVKGTGLFATTDEQGRFVLGAMPPGEYTLVAWPAKGKPKESKIVVPIKQPDSTYDIEL